MLTANSSCEYCKNKIFSSYIAIGCNLLLLFVWWPTPTLLSFVCLAVSTCCCVIEQRIRCYNCDVPSHLLGGHSLWLWAPPRSCCALLLLRHVSFIFREHVRDNEAGLHGRRSEIITGGWVSLFQRGLCVFLPSCRCLTILLSRVKNRRPCSSHVYRSSDSLRTRTSLICSIRLSSPSMSWTVMLESAIEITSSAAKKRNNEHQHNTCDNHNSTVL